MPPEVEEWMNSSIQDGVRSGAVVHGKDPGIVGSIEARSQRVPTLSARQLKALSEKQLKQRSLQTMNKPNSGFKSKSSHLKKDNLESNEADPTKANFQMNNQNFIPIRPKGARPVVLKVLAGPKIPGGPQGPTIAKVEGGSGTGPRVVVLQNVKPPDENVKVEIDDEEGLEEAILPEVSLKETNEDIIPGLIRGEVPTLSVEHLRRLSRPARGQSGVQQGCNSIDIFLGPVSGPEPCPSHFWSYETYLNL